MAVAIGVGEGIAVADFFFLWLRGVADGDGMGIAIGIVIALDVLVAAGVDFFVVDDAAPAVPERDARAPAALACEVHSYFPALVLPKY